MQVALSNPGCAQSFPPAALRSLLLLERHAAAPGEIEHSCVKGPLNEERERERERDIESEREKSTARIALTASGHPTTLMDWDS